MLAGLRVPRVAAPVPRFRSGYVATRQPVLIDGLFDDQPIRKLATARAARRAIGDMDFVVQWNYVANLYYANAEQAGQPEPHSTGDSHRCCTPARRRWRSDLLHEVISPH
jgi:hypothetical protein